MSSTPGSGLAPVDRRIFVVTGGLLAREFGGGRTAQLIGALGVATSPVLLAADHTLGTGGHIYLCRDPVRSWGQLWPSFRHYN